LHGFTGNACSFAPLGLPDAHTPLLTGHGPAPHLLSQSFGQEVERIAAVVQRRSAPVHLVGYSMGARVALAVALDHPALIAQLSLVGVNPGLQTDPERQARLNWEARWQDVLEVDGLAVFEHQWSSLPLFSSQARVSAEVHAAQRAERLRHTAWGLSHALSVLGLAAMPNLWPRLPDLRVPTQLIVGELDEKFLNIAQVMCDQCARCRLLCMPQVGHNPIIEAPEELRALLLGAAEVNS
jgi:2-succinyl-6-hydroxy-2,4-cyclohexadiene-1-carboxylate synthase